MLKDSMMREVKDLLDNGGAMMLIQSVFMRHHPGTRLTRAYITKRAWEIAMEVVNDEQAKYLRSVHGCFSMQMSIDMCISCQNGKTMRIVTGPTGGIELL